MPPRHRYGCRCAACAAAVAVALLATGRAEQALALLRGLPARIAEEADLAWSNGFDRGAHGGGPCPSDGQPSPELLS